MRALGLTALAGLLYCAAHPPLGASVLAFVALAPLLVALRGVGIARGFGLGWVAGTIACNGLTSASIFAALVRARHPAWLAGTEAIVIPQLCGALYFGAFGAYVALLERRRPGTPWRLLVLPAAWVVGELARSRIGYGMPWVLLAHSQVRQVWLLQVADVVGAYGVSFVVALVNVLVATLLAPPAAGARWRLRAPLAVAASLLAATLAYGRVQLVRWRAPGGAPLDVALVQGDLPDAWRTSLPDLPRAVARYRDLVTRVAADRPDLVILPENAVSVSASANPHLLAEVASPLAGTEAMLLVGAPRDVALGPGRASIRNSAYLLDAEGTIRAVYDKRHLVPFGEVSTWLVPAVLQRRVGLTDNYVAGDVATLFEVAGVRFATLICWEGIYAETVRGLVRAGAELLVNLSNDDWFGGHAAREQHFQATLLRAVEARRFLVRVTNSGATAIVDPRGVVVVAVPRDTAADVRGRVTAEDVVTVYARIGDAFAWGCVLLVAWAVIAPSSRRRMG